jgi:hypothetical protein
MHNMERVKQRVPNRMHKNVLSIQHHSVISKAYVNNVVAAIGTNYPLI